MGEENFGIKCFVEFDVYLIFLDVKYQLSLVVHFS